MTTDFVEQQKNGEVRKKKTQILGGQLPATEPTIRAHSIARFLHGQVAFLNFQCLNGNKNGHDHVTVRKVRSFKKCQNVRD